MTDGENIVALPEYANNPFISRLRPPSSIIETVNELHNPIRIDASERLAPPHVRRHCVMRLMDWFFPTTDHCVFAERIDMLIRRGYLGRNPADGTWTRRLARSADLRESGIPFFELQPSDSSSAHALSLLGTPGMGKTRTSRRILRSYDQVIVHEAPNKIRQLTYLEVECPTGGSLRQLLKNILTEIDRALGQRKYHRAGRAEVDDLLFEVAQALQVHAVGVLVIDEINFLNAAKTDKDRVVNFLTSLVNVFCVPVLFVGTLEAASVLSGTFRNGRRASGLGSMAFEPWRFDDQWEDFIKRLFNYQWLSTPTAYTEELSKAIWEESRGILDVVVKLFILAQFRVIRAFELDGTDEVLSVELFRDISRTDLKLIQPMLNALRDGTPQALAQYPDLKPLHTVFERTLSKAGVVLGGRGIGHMLDAPVVSQSPEEALLTALRAFGIPQDQAASVVSRLGQGVDLSDPLAVMDTLPQTVQEAVDQAPRRHRRKPDPSSLPVGDVRRVCDEGGSAYEALKRAGMMGTAV